jgi:hypothetical protein
VRRGSLAFVHHSRTIPCPPCLTPTFRLRFATVSSQGNIDANTGDAQTGWDTDQFLTDPAVATLVMSVVIKQGGLAPGGINFDAKLRRESTHVTDLIVAHIGAMDALARGLRNAAALKTDGALDSLVRVRHKEPQPWGLRAQHRLTRSGIPLLWTLSNPIPAAGGGAVRFIRHHRAWQDDREGPGVVRGHGGIRAVARLARRRVGARRAG